MSSRGKTKSPESSYPGRGCVLRRVAWAGEPVAEERGAAPGPTGRAPDRAGTSVHRRRPQKWPDDVAAHLEEWLALAMAVESGDIQGNAVITSDAKSGEQFRGEHNQELARVAN